MYLPPEQNNNSKHCIIFLSCYSPELGPAPAAHKCTDDVPASSSFPTASAGRCAAGDVSANTGDQCTGHRCSDGGSPGDLGHHDRVSVQHICSSTPDSRTLNQSCHCKNAAPRIISVHSFCTLLCLLWFLHMFWIPAQINAASLGAQPQFLSSLTSTPIITSAMSNMAGITSQIITNAQGQVSPINCGDFNLRLVCQPPHSTLSFQQKGRWF